MPDPAGTTPPTALPGPDDAADIIHIGDARRARTTAPPEPQESTVGATGQHHDPTPEERLAEIVQGLFKKHKFAKKERTLTDPATAQAYDITLSVVLHLVDGAMAEGGLQEEQYQLLQGMLEQARQVPGII